MKKLFLSLAFLVSITTSSMCMTPEAYQRYLDNYLLIQSSLGKTGMVKSCLEAKADPNAKDNQNWTALTHAALVGMTKIAQLLLEAKADPNAKTSHQITPLMFASSLYSIEVAQLLLKYDADVNAQDCHGQTPLMRAHNPDLIKLLLINGAKLNIKDRNGWTARIIAEMHQYLAVFDQAGQQELIERHNDIAKKRIIAAIKDWQQCPLELLKYCIQPYLISHSDDIPSEEERHVDELFLEEFEKEEHTVDPSVFDEI
jgi:ankyrin repeat protein